MGETLEQKRRKDLAGKQAMAAVEKGRAHLIALDRKYEDRIPTGGRPSGDTEAHSAAVVTALVDLRIKLQAVASIIREATICHDQGEGPRLRMLLAQASAACGEVRL